MLELTDLIMTRDAKANDIIKNHISLQLLQLIEQLENVTSDVLNLFFPEHYPHCKKEAVINDLVALLKSKYSYTPALIQEYVLYKSIKNEVDKCRTLNKSTINLIAYEERNYVLNIRYKESDDYFIEENDKPYEFIKFLMNCVEDFSYYEISCFRNISYRLLDKMSEEEIYYSDINKSLEIGTKESIIYIPNRKIY